MDDFPGSVIEQLAGLGAVTVRRMFGGHGLYCEELFFGLIDDGVLYLKVDDSNRADFVKRDCQAFKPFKDKPASLSYFEIPPEVLERPARAAEWARRSMEIARSKRAKARKKKRAGSKASKSQAPRKLRNIGPKSAAWLAAVGIRSRADLEKAGSIGAFRAVRASGQSASLNLLYALEGALLDVHWNELPAPLKDRLRKAAAD